MIIELVRLWVLLVCSFWFLFFDNRKAPKWRGSRIISLISEDLIPEPSKTSCQRSKSNSLIPTPSPWENHFRPLFEGLKSSSRVPARTWGYIIFNSNISGDKAATKHFYIVFFRDQSPLLWTPPLWLMVSSRSQPFPQWFAKVSTITMIIFIGWDWLSRNLWLTIPILTHILRSNSTILIHFLELRS